MPWPDDSHPLICQFDDALSQAGYREAGLRQAVGTSSNLNRDGLAARIAALMDAAPTEKEILTPPKSLGLRLVGKF